MIPFPRIVRRVRNFRVRFAYTTSCYDASYQEQSREDKMRAIVSMVAAVGMLSAGVTIAAAVPADGTAIARLGQQVDAVVVVKKTKKPKKPKTRTTGTPIPPPRQPQSY
jgi:hypothetical protein